jgi:hypothetical protein
VKQSELKQLIKEVKKEISFSLIPKTIKIVQEEFIKSIPNNDYFTSGEKQALSLYLESHSSFHRKNIVLFESQVNEGIADWFRSGWEKVKSTFGGIKNYVVKVWAQIKKAFTDLISKGKTAIKGLIEKNKNKITEAFKKALNGPDRDDLIAEINYILKIDSFFKGKIEDPSTMIDAIGDKVVEPVIAKAEEAGENIQENIFNKQTTEHLNNPNILLEAEENSKWKAWLGNIIKIALNPVMGIVSITGSWASSKILTLISKFIEKIGGPKAMEFHVIPELISAVMEISGVFNSSWSWVEEKIKEYSAYIPYADDLIKIWEFGHYVLLAYAIIELIKESWESISSIVKNIKSPSAINESLSLEFIRMQKLAGI